MTKRITITTRPQAVAPKTADDWVDKEVDSNQQKSEKPVRLTFDLDRSIHTKLRRYCLDQDIHVSAFIRRLIAGSLSG